MNLGLSKDFLAFNFKNLANQSSENIKNLLQQTLLELHQKNSAALESVKAGWTEAKPADKFMLVDDSYYENLINLSGNRERSMKIINRFAK